MKTKFYRSGNLIASVDIDRNVCYAAARHGSADVYGRYELGRSYVAPVSEGKPVFSGFPLRRWKRLKLSAEAILILKTENIILSA